MNGPRTDIIRDGRTGAAGEVLTQTERQAIDDACRAELLELGSDLPYDALFATR